MRRTPKEGNHKQTVLFSTKKKDMWGAEKDAAVPNPS